MSSYTSRLLMGGVMQHLKHEVRDVDVNGSPLARGAGLARGNSRETTLTQDNAALSDFPEWRAVGKVAA